MATTGIKYYVGKDRFGGNVTLSNSDARGWEIVREAANEGGESVRLDGLTTENFALIFAATKSGSV